MLQTAVLRWLGLATVDLDRVARSLADGLLDIYDPVELEPRGTQQYLRTAYMRLVNHYGLPAACCNEVADRAWAIVAELRGGSPDAATSGANGFVFYD